MVFTVKLLRDLITIKGINVKKLFSRRLLILLQRVISVLIVLILVLGIAFAIVLVIQRVSNMMFDTTITAEVIAAPMVFGRLQSQSELMIAPYQFSNAAMQVTAGQGAICRWYATHALQGTLSVGVNLRLMDETDVTYRAEEDRYQITLPSPKFIRCAVDSVNFSQYNQRGEIPVTCPMDWNILRNLASYDAITEARDQAIAEGFLVEAEDAIRLEIGDLVRDFTGREAVIRFDPTKNPTLYDSTCQPDTDGWSYDLASNVWFRGE